MLFIVKQSYESVFLPAMIWHTNRLDQYGSSRDVTLLTPGHIPKHLTLERFNQRYELSRYTHRHQDSGHSASTTYNRLHMAMMDMMAEDLCKFYGFRWEALLVSSRLVCFECLSKAATWLIVTLYDFGFETRSDQISSTKRWVKLQTYRQLEWSRKLVAHK